MRPQAHRFTFYPVVLHFAFLLLRFYKTYHIGHIMAIGILAIV